MEVLHTLEAIARERYVPPYTMAQVRLGLGHHEQALDWLDRAFEVHDVYLILLPADPKWHPVRGHARFLALLKRCAFTTPALLARSTSCRLRPELVPRNHVPDKRPPPIPDCGAEAVTLRRYRKSRCSIACISACGQFRRTVAKLPSLFTKIDALLPSCPSSDNDRGLTPLILR